MHLRWALQVIADLFDTLTRMHAGGEVLPLDLNIPLYDDRHITKSRFSLAASQRSA